MLMQIRAGILINPWNLAGKVSGFSRFLSGASVFISPVIGIMFVKTTLAEMSQLTACFQVLRLFRIAKEATQSPRFVHFEPQVNLLVLQGHELASWVCFHSHFRHFFA